MCAKMIYGVSLKGMRETFGETLIEIGKENEKLIVIDCETGTSTNILEFRDRYPERFVSMGVAEQNAISFAFGVARMGYIPVVPLFCCFVSRRACDQLFIQVGYANENIKIFGHYAGLTTPNNGATHQSINDIAIIRTMPNILVIETADTFELRQAIKKVIKYKGPVYLRVIRGDIFPYDNQRVVPENHEFEIGKASVLREGKDISLIGSGFMVSRCLEAAKILKNKEIDAEVINCSSIKPLDKETILKSVKKTNAAVTAENHSTLGGVGSAVAEMLIQEYPIPLKMVGINDTYGESAELKDLFQKYGLTSEEIVNASLETINKK